MWGQKRTGRPEKRQHNSSGHWPGSVCRATTRSAAPAFASICEVSWPAGNIQLTLFSRQPMRRSANFTLVAAFALPVPAFAQFEGVVTARMAAQQRSMDVTYSIKGGHFRMDMSGMGGMSVYILHLASAPTSQMVIPSQKMYMEMRNAEAVTGQSAATKAPDIKWTGKKETVAGIECEHVIVTDDKGTQADVCAAKGMGSFFSAQGPMGGRGSNTALDAWQRVGAGSFPLKIQRVGGETILEVTRVEKKSLADEIFTVPSGYQKMDMGGIPMGRPLER